MNILINFAPARLIFAAQVLLRALLLLLKTDSSLFGC
jgi:hypothetical protein